MPTFAELSEMEKRVTNFDAARLHFLSDVFVAAAAVVA